MCIRLRQRQADPNGRLPAQACEQGKVFPDIKAPETIPEVGSCQERSDNSRPEEARSKAQPSHTL